jgi:hypothetical protein
LSKQIPGVSNRGNDAVAQAEITKSGSGVLTAMPLS